MHRFFDLLISSIGILILLLPMAVIACIIKIDSKGPVFFRQARVGQHGIIFKIYKFRTMYSDNNGDLKLTIGYKDKRITRVGFYLRKYKIDEIPQLFNVLSGQMSMVGPRPEVPEYVTYYSDRDKELLSIKPGLTDNASIKYFNENEILAKSKNPHDDYINVIMKEKLELNRKYLYNNDIKSYFKIIFNTFLSVLKKL